MTTPWRDIAESRRAEGRFWTPDLSLDLMGRDWGKYETQQPVIGPRITGGGAGTFTINTTTVKEHTGASATFIVRFPNDWEDDDTYASFEYTVAVPLFVYGTGGPAFVSFHHRSDLGIGNAAFNGVAGIDYNVLDTDAIPDTEGNRIEFLLWRKFKGLPKGIQLYTFVSHQTGTNGTLKYSVHDPISDTTSYELWPGGAGRLVIDT